MNEKECSVEYVFVGEIVYFIVTRSTEKFETYIITAMYIKCTTLGCHNEVETKVALEIY